MMSLDALLATEISLRHLTLLEVVVQANFAVSWTFPVVAQASGGHAFAFFSAMMVLQFFFVWKIMPETKGLSLEELEVKLGLGSAELEALERQLHPDRANVR